MRKSRLFTIILFIIFIALLVLSKKASAAFIEGITLWFRYVLPSLFPFFFLTRLMATTDGVSFISKLLKKPFSILFHAPEISSHIFLMSALSSYPIGAKLISDAYEAQLISTDDAQKIASFASTSGLTFTVATVGSGMFGSSKIGICIFLSHILSAIVTGIIFRGKPQKQKPYGEFIRASYDDIFGEAVYSSVTSILVVGGYMALFYVAIDLLSPIICILFPNQYLQAVIGGLIECTAGCGALSTLPNNRLAAALAAGIISFGGISIFFQCLAFMKKTKIRADKYLLSKIVQMMIATPLCYLLLLI